MNYRLLSVAERESADMKSRQPGLVSSSSRSSKRRWNE
jgi:hypothetical protein